MIFLKRTAFNYLNSNSRKWNSKYMINAQNLPFRCPRAAARQSSTLLRAIFDDLYANRIAITDIDGNKYTYRELKQCSYSLASHISEKRNMQEGNKLKCIANYNPAGMNYVVTMLAGWILNCTVVPLSTSHTTEELVYYIKDSHAELVVTGDAHVSQMNDLAKLWESKHNDCSPLESLVIESKIFDDVDANSTIDASLKSHSSAEASSPSSLIVYTSGTTGFPKGVVHSDMSLHAMTASLVEAWQYTPEDKILHFLPLHHVHGIVNKLLCVLYAGGHVEFMPSANPVLIWKRLAQESAPRVGGLVPHDQKLSFFMGVPTVYARLMESADSIRSSTSTASSYPSITPAELNAGIETLRSMRLHVSGSAALPYPVMTAWEELTGHVLLERYGMTEIGMALSNTYLPLSERTLGSVGVPLPGVCVKVVNVEDEEGKADTNESKDVNAASEIGELRIKGPAVFSHYFNKPDATASAFDENGWFRTGDIVKKLGCKYYILGRSSTDIIKSGGYKLSSLEIEREILSCPRVSEVAVVGRPDNVFGEIVVAVVVWKASSSKNVLELELSEFLKSRLAAYKRPKQIHMVSKIPRNMMGKVNKKSLLSDLGLE